jgi:hypothetical protein
MSTTGDDPTRTDETTTDADDAALVHDGADGDPGDVPHTSLAPSRRKRGRSPGRMAHRYGPIVVVAAVVVGALVVVSQGSGDDDGDEPAGAEPVDREQLIMSGPMTPERARLENASVSFGPGCDVNLGRITLPTVYAPPCVAPFEGDNGGATSTGVTGDTVKLVAYLRNPDPLTGAVVEQDAGRSLDEQEQRQTIQDYVDLYNRVFELYGRQVEVEFFVGTGGTDDTQAARADAIAIAESEPFAVIGGPDQASPVFADELAAREVLCLLESCATGLPSDFLAERAPYVWMAGGGEPEGGIPMTAEAISKLAGPGKAEMAGDPELQEQDRVYGAVHYNSPEGLQEEPFAAFVDGLTEVGVEIDADVEYFLDINRVQEDARSIIAQLKDAGVTTVIFQGEGLTAAALTQEATAQDYFPEWIHADGYLVDLNSFARTFDHEQWRNGFGLLARSASSEEMGVAYQLYRWAYGTNPPSNIAAGLETAIRMLFTGVHLAGENLTPESFRDGVLRMPPSGGGPTRPALAWGDRPWTGLDDPQADTAIAWWDPEAEGVESGEPVVGMYRFANEGQRYRSGEIPDSPDEAGLFDTGSSVLEYTELPEQDRTPDYPPPDPAPPPSAATASPSRTPGPEGF